MRLLWNSRVALGRPADDAECRLNKTLPRSQARASTLCASRCPTGLSRPGRASLSSPKSPGRASLRLPAFCPSSRRLSSRYFLKAIEWARKYGLRINLDFHCLPGSQNGWNHSGKLGSINVLNGPMGLANTQRTLSYIKIIAEFISQPEYSAIVPIFGVTNEPVGSTIGQDNLAA